MNQFLKVYEMQVGLSTGTFSFDGQGLKTATEVVSENSMTYQTRNSHLNNVERAIKELIVSAMELAQSMGAYSGEVPTLQEIELNFDDGVFLDKNAQLDYFTKMNIAGFASKKQAIMTLNDVDEKRAEQILAEIAAESQPEFDGNDANMYRQTGDDE
jgi:A118 family predicted phage portal protein